MTQKTSSLTTLFQSYAQNDNPPIIQLLNRDHEPVAALYLDKLKLNIEDVVVCESTTNEKYYLYMNGIAVFFTYYKKN